jgi:predicted PurR-regulated permease PerM
MLISFPFLAAYGLFIACLAGALLFHAIPALLAGLLSFNLTRSVLHRLRRLSPSRSVEWLAAFVVGLGSLAALVAVGTEIHHYLVGDSLPALMLTLADTLQHIKRYLPVALANQVPDSFLEAKGLVATALKSHANTLARVGSSALEHVALTLIGWIVGVLVAIQVGRADNAPPFAATWRRLWGSLSAAFGRVALAQAKIAAVNATLTAIYLLVIMPLLGWKMPYAATLIVLTFVCGLLPVIGNLISNSLLCTLALSVAFPAAVVSLAFLLLVHKIEYFLSARIQGQEIGASAWELLIVLFAFEVVFGPAGMVAAPVFYAFAIAELRFVGWVDSLDFGPRLGPEDVICRD